MKKEIERRFLLKDMPISPNGYHEIQHIIQYYYLDEGVWKRIRKIESSIYGNTYLHTIKSYIDGITYETENFVSYEDYKTLINKIHNNHFESKCLIKTRYILPVSETEVEFEGEFKKIKWEIDVFNFNLVIAEIEIPDINYSIIIPDFIQSKLIYEVTGIKELSNRNLAEPLKGLTQLLEI